MTREDIIRMAREAGCTPFRSPEYWDDVQVFATPDVLERFANLVAAAEREACAKVAESYEPRCDSCPSGVANAIRARGQG
jgi:hypothetical protein